MQERIDHIYTKQVFGIAITELTALLSRRSVYCSKRANGRYSVCTKFKDENGNIRFKRGDHDWQGASCKYCGASKEVHTRDESLETHAYEFIHTKKPEAVFDMRFDVVVGNPPYQLSDGGFGRSAGPLYHKFVEQAVKLNPRYLTMIIPSRWFAGGKGLDDFRKSMLNDSSIRYLIDYWDSRECFPGVDIAGGICYFLRERDYKGHCEITNIYKGKTESSTRPLNEFDTLIRFGTAVEIVKKIQSKSESTMDSIVSSRKPFGLATNVRPEESGDLTLVWNGGSGPFPSDEVSVGRDLIDKWKVITSNTSYDHGGQPNSEGKRRVLSKIEVLSPGTICTETYIVAGIFDNKKDAESLVSYLETKFVRFLISLLSFSHHVTKGRFSFVPHQENRIQWSDDMLIKKYELTKHEVEFIESMIMPMRRSDER